jgi:hypothetical protein
MKQENALKKLYIALLFTLMPIQHALANTDSTNITKDNAKKIKQVL